ncbi:hypothetical protein [Ferrimonas marina]|uniref:Uncharacterized protein n=1 Tax=Ferrimonas marina TaxID=299255 RepID=A0A1M5UJE0_9GAMM|nr:hypothetical protein [Ferrimonas marina]SHH63018.1 hypothetical protein SAMN02745129_2597 [Ferrimonas marina]
MNLFSDELNEYTRTHPQLVALCLASGCVTAVCLFSAFTLWVSLLLQFGLSVGVLSTLLARRRTALMAVQQGLDKENWSKHGVMIAVTAGFAVYLGFAIAHVSFNHAGNADGMGEAAMTLSLPNWAFVLLSISAVTLGLRFAIRRACAYSVATAVASREGMNDEAFEHLRKHVLYIVTRSIRHTDKWGWAALVVVFLFTPVPATLLGGLALGAYNWVFLVMTVLVIYRLDPPTKHAASATKPALQT